MLSKKLAGFISDMNFAHFPAHTVHMAKMAFLDWLGSTAAGGMEAPFQKAYAVIRGQGGFPQATILAIGEKTSCLNAALANGLASHIIELDDVHRAAIIHAGAAVIPAALAVAEMNGAAGKQLLEAIVAGYEVAIRVGESITPAHYFYWHTTGTCGTFGAAAAAGKLLGLTIDQLVWALGNAGTQAAGLWEFLADGAMSKHLHPGKAAQNGVLAALLAREDFTGATRILEGERGFCRATADSFDLDKLTSGLGQPPYKIEENSFKIHASCRHTHPAIDVILGLSASNGVKTDDIEEIRIHTYGTALSITENYKPSSVYAAKFSLPFCAALALKNGRCGLADFTEEALADPEIRDLMDKVVLTKDEGLDALHPACWPTIVEITCRTGGTCRERTDFPRGDPENPVSTDELLAKFRTLAAGPWGEKKVRGLEKAVLELENVENVRDLV
ncbi:MmgE/PrpD family protein [Pelotomaculum propionicicum]|uniref:2-methylcitrate dehydratase 2 n=1 Tax=Pelotomaculum propionicicum TaxID=258475 RepID=A0A4Y7RK23_9FIRM|nr:MmgE/PrpD family protein [Pelotomaculum propionicicum]NLI11542.1 MmgE/PrpD family protein [Peptococcaceae bacterium]TEB09193.1 2-methylcitrate dehydratase 2 [Pelotomaculum propionicicum]